MRRTTKRRNPTQKVFFFFYPCTQIYIYNKGVGSQRRPEQALQRLNHQNWATNIWKVEGSFPPRPRAPNWTHKESLHGQDHQTERGPALGSVVWWLWPQQHKLGQKSMFFWFFLWKTFYFAWICFILSSLHSFTQFSSLHSCKSEEYCVNYVFLIQQLFDDEIDVRNNCCIKKP